MSTIALLIRTDWIACAKRFGLEVAAADLDAGYFTPHICKGLIERDIYGVIGYCRPNHKDGYFYKREYVYDPERDGYVCPNAT